MAKFWDESDKELTLISSRSLNKPIDEMIKCLESENVSITRKDLCKCIDLFIRIMNRDTIFSGANYGINHIVNINTIYEDFAIDGKEFVKEALCSYFLLVDTMSEIKFDDFDSVTKNISIIFHEICIFVNDVFKEFIDNAFMYGETAAYSGDAIVLAFDDRYISFTTFISDFNSSTYVIKITSTVHGDISPIPTYIEFTFSDIQQSMIYAYLNKDKLAIDKDPSLVSFDINSITK